LEIHVQLFSILRDKLPPESKGKALLHLKSGSSLQDLLNDLSITRKAVISVNSVQEMDLSRQLQDGDIVKMFSSISGG